MLIAILGVLTIVGLLNMIFYEYRVIKVTNTSKTINFIGWKDL